ncbi:uncharacterized protein BP01DRAFT_382199 [Aspergillus saccharolyticus JOP 1030-1]|uniref:Uncharacterized protein n=1 Tax=Aspergillus saccharolyticus JOP 1030-1 TaxID=1450539 RepID=A0A318ZGY5_9EURO|nr:hypothetical protein BP01DRAFT_382199 [Aspergillus saccharolyticus JOP 1030-1]PYH46017.1 hypothetical protein BP01DRAFT_382199 [Aspergillus saccharolyticus JOP 1030-1]
MDSSSQMSSEMSWLNDASPLSMTPRTATPQTPQRSRADTPENEPSAPLVNPSSGLLQDLLKEQRASRSSKGGSDEHKQCNPRTPERRRPKVLSPSQSPARSHAQSQTQSRGQSWEEVGSDKQRRVHSVASSGTRQPNDMGVREMGEYVSKINKQNFDLKLEIFHRVQQVTALEKKLQRMEEMEEELQRLRCLEEEVQELREAEADNQRLRESNEELRQEIDRRDHAITEAVSMICLLESKVTELQAGEDSSRPSTARPDEEDSTTPKQKVVVQIPDRTSSKGSTDPSATHRKTSVSHQLQRAPSFLRDGREDPAALQSFCEPSEDQAHAAMTEITKSESLQSINDPLDPESPRLSALSECSELFPLGSDGDVVGFDQLAIPVIRKDFAADGSELSDLSGSRSRDRIESWVSPPHDVFVDEASRCTTQSSISQGPKKTSFDSDSYGSSQKTHTDSVFGTSKLPPTPDTMSTAYVAGTSCSNGSIIAEKSHYDQGVALGLMLRRPRSADELTTKRSSCQSIESDKALANVSDVTLPRQSTDGGDMTPTLFPLNYITSRDDRLFNQDSLNKISLGHYGGSALYNEDSLEKVLSKIDKNLYQAKPSRSIEELSAPLSASPPLTSQEWVDAAKLAPRGEKSQPELNLGPITLDSRLLVARAPSQASFLGRRHSIDSGFREADVPRIPTLDLQSLDPRPHPEPDTERRKRISLRPLFGRSGNARRLQTTPLHDQTDSDEGAPAPVIHKTRNTAPSRPPRVKQHSEGHRDLSASMPTYADGMADEARRTLPHSFTESSFTSNQALKPLAASNKDHKRRSSLGLFGWMKGSSKKPEPLHSPVKHAMPPSGILKDRPTRMAQEFGTQAHHEPARNLDTPTVSFALDARSRGSVRSDEEDPARRPRYMDRKSRRG